MLYLLIETFRGGDPRPVYERFAGQGRLAPPGLTYVASWVTADLQRCFQVVECDDPALLEAWMARWRDLVDFEVLPVITSAAAAAAVAVLEPAQAERAQITAQLNAVHGPDASASAPDRTLAALQARVLGIPDA